MVIVANVCAQNSEKGGYMQREDKKQLNICVVRGCEGSREVETGINAPQEAVRDFQRRKRAGREKLQLGRRRQEPEVLLKVKEQDVVQGIVAIASQTFFFNTVPETRIANREW